jgi:hypothetical protein
MKRKYSLWGNHMLKAESAFTGTWVRPVTSADYWLQGFLVAIVLIGVLAFVCVWWQL